jgi:hypothetical protein
VSWDDALDTGHSFAAIDADVRGQQGRPLARRYPVKRGSGKAAAAGSILDLGLIVGHCTAEPAARKPTVLSLATV